MGGAATEEQVAAAYQPWSSGSGPWDAALSVELPEYAVKLGVPAPATRRELLRLLVAAGLVTTDGETRYRVVETPPRAEDVLRLPAGQSATIRGQDAHRRYAPFAADLWTMGRAAAATAEAWAGGDPSGGQ
ncbi:DUF6042 family protein [Nonomuraea solani]|uniref:DUF6042 family protein n=1 Tax=Nonomuraea solani TaxID=1144553 RepID=UPI000CDED171|nr:DUF6042 family protein [Nonomuraea solani]